MTKPTQARLQELTNFDPLTGVFTRKKQLPGWKVGQEMGSINSDGYTYIGIDGSYFFAQRLAWLFVYGEAPDKQIDHINRDKTDNRIENLRLVSRSENRQNMGAYKSNASGVRGVHWFKAGGKWQAQISNNGKKFHLGFFDDIAAAASAYAKAAAKLHKYNPFAESATQSALAQR